MCIYIIHDTVLVGENLSLGLVPCNTQTSLLSYRDKIDSWMMFVKLSCFSESQ